MRASKFVLLKPITRLHGLESPSLDSHPTVHMTPTGFSLLPPSSPPTQARLDAQTRLEDAKRLEEEAARRRTEASELLRLAKKDHR